jgi:hypothetical protein
MIVPMGFLALLEGGEDGVEGRSPAPACAGRRRREVTPRADALSSRLRREVFKDVARVVITAFLRSAAIERCAPAAAQANKGLKMFVKAERGALFTGAQSLTCGSAMPSKPLKNGLT